MKIKAINGFKDILPQETLLWQKVENTARNIFARFGLEEIRTPVLEKTELFCRSIGEATDIVEKEMYTFSDKQITMRPEATASLLRAFIEHGLHLKKPVQKLYTIGPMFRHERPQKGRLRQFHQIDAEIIGTDEPAIDAELIAMASMLLDALEINTSLEINSLGCPNCRPNFKKELINFLNDRKEQLCQDCQRRIDLNPLRSLDCKNRDCKKIVADAPSILDSLCSECDNHLKKVEKNLQRLQIDYQKNRFMVRGLDYYTRTTFEFTTDQLGSQSAVGAGGRYNNLIKELGGPDLPGIGFALGMERVILLMQQNEASHDLKHETDIFIAALGEQAIKKGCELAHSLRKNGIRTGLDYSNRSLKAQMKQAGRANSRYVLIMGEEELENKQAQLRNMNSKEQVAFPLHDSLEKQAEQLKRIILNE